MIMEGNFSVEKEINKAMEEGKLVIGKERTVKYLKNGKVKTVILASNVPKDILIEIEHNAKISKADVVRYEGNNKELGALCRKPFLVTVVSILK